MPPYAEAFSRARPKWKWAGAAWRGARNVAQRSGSGRHLQSLVTKGKRGSPVIRQVMLIYHLLRLLSDWGKGATEAGDQTGTKGTDDLVLFPKFYLTNIRTDDAGLETTELLRSTPRSCER